MKNFSLPFCLCCLAWAAFACEMVSPVSSLSHRSGAANDGSRSGEADSSSAWEHTVPDSIVIADEADSTGAPRDTVTSPKPVVYICGIEVPPGYNWVEDSLAGQEECRLVLLRDSIRLVDIPAGAAAETGTDPDEHFIVDGHLISAFYGPLQTVMRCDGTELLRYWGSEHITGLTVHGLDGSGETDIWTLGYTDSRSGIVLRRNGTEVLARTGASATELYEDSGHVYFAYSSKVAGSECWTLVEDGRERALSFERGLTIHDVRIVGGKLRALVTDKDHCSYVLYEDGSTDLINCSAFFIESAGYWGCEGGPLAVGTMKNLYSSSKYDFHMVDGNAVCFDKCDEFYAFRGPDDVAGISYASDGSFSADFGLHHFEAQDGWWRILGRQCAAYVGGELYMVLNDKQTLEPALWRSGELSAVALNGYLTGIAVYLE